MNWHFKRLFSEITSVWRAIPRFFLEFSRCNKDTLTCRIDICPYIHFRLKVIPSWMEKGLFYANATTGYQSKRVCVGWIGSYAINSISQQGMQHKFEYSNRVIYRKKIICNKTGGLAINLYRKLTTYAKDVTFSRICSRLVNVGMIWFYSVKSQTENNFSDICYKLFSLFFCIIFDLFCTWS